MVDLTGLINSGATVQEILDALRGDLEGTIGKFKEESKTAYQEAIESLRGNYETAAEDRGSSFEDRYSFLADNLANLGVPFGGDLANQWATDNAYLTESADLALATDLAWFEKMMATQPEIYNAMLTELAAQIALTQALGNTGGSGGGYSGGGGRSGGGGYSAPVGDWDETTSVTTRNDFERDFPGFIEAVQEGGLRGQWNENQWAYFNNLIDEYSKPKDMIGQIIDDLGNTTEASSAAQRLLDFLNTGVSGEISQPLPVGDGTFTCESRRIPSTNDVENLPELDNYGHARQLLAGPSMTRLMQENPFIISPDAEEKQARLNSTESALNTVTSQRHSLSEAAQNTIRDAEAFSETVNPVREFLRYWDPIRGWVNTEMTADEYWRSQNKVKKQPAPPAIDPFNYQATRRQNIESSKEAETRAYWENQANQNQNSIEDVNSSMRSRLEALQQRRIQEQKQKARELEMRRAMEERARQELARRNQSSKPKPKPKPKPSRSFTSHTANNYR